MMNKKMIMIRVSTHSKSRFVYTPSSSFLLSPTINLTRSYCSNECSLVQLSADIEYVYNNLTNKTPYSLSRDRLAVIQQMIVLGLYDLSPLQVILVDKGYIVPFFYDMQEVTPDFMYVEYPDSDMTMVVLPEIYDDVLVLMGLSRMLLRLSHVCLLKDCYVFSVL